MSLDLPADTPTALRDFVAADLARDHERMAASLAPNCVLRSPLTESFRFHGRHDVSQVYGAAFEVLGDFAMTDLTGTGRTWCFAIAGRTRGGRPFDEVQLLRLSDEGLIEEITMFGRPVPGLLEVMGSIGGVLERRGVLPRGSGAAGGGVRPISLILGLVERHLLPRFAPAGNDRRP